MRYIYISWTEQFKTHLQQNNSIITNTATQTSSLAYITAAQTQIQDA